MGLSRLPLRGLTPILVLLAIAPPRACTCDHDEAAAACVADPAADHRDDSDSHDHSDCPCVKPAQLPPATLAAGVAPPPPPALHLMLAVPAADGPAGDAPAPVARRTGDPPLYLTHCNLRF